MRLPTFLALLILVICASCSTLTSPVQNDRVLFVGNSLTYVGNVPAVFSALAEANGRPIVSDMIVRGGATLTQRVADGSVARALTEAKYTTLVLQERGGDLMCSLGVERCGQSRKAINALAALAKEHDVNVVLLGTYQNLPDASQELIQGESSAAAEAGISYVAVSEELLKLRATAPELTWFASDGLHPGKDLALLNAMLVHKAVLGSLPRKGPITVSAPIYGSTSGLKESLRQSDAPPPRPDTPMEVRYSSDTLGKLLQSINHEGSG
jgi:hypothetical protein